MNTPAEIVQHAIRTSRNENRTVHISPDDRAHAHELYQELFAVCDDSIDDRCDQIFWGEGWQICLYYPYYP
jgi:hypothetical protein